MSRGTIHYRPLRWPGDRAGLARLDASLATDTVYEVRAGPLGFALVEERPADPPLRKRYDLPVDDLPSLSAAVVAEGGGEVLGVAALALEAWNRRAVVAHLYVHRPARGRGIGAGLLREVERHARALGARCLWVETQNVNAPAIRFYRRHGFACCGLDTTLYDPRDAPGETAVFLALELGDPEPPAGPRGGEP